MGFTKRSVTFKLSGGTMEKITSVNLYYSNTELPPPGTDEETSKKIWGTEGFWTKYDNGYNKSNPITLNDLTEDGFKLTYEANVNKRQGVSDRFNTLRNNSKSPIAGDYGKDFDKRLDYASFVTLFITGVFKVSKDKTVTQTVVLSDLLIGQTEKDWYISGPKMDGEHFHFLFWQESFIGQVCLLASKVSDASKNEYTLAPGAAMVALGEVDSKEHFHLYISKF